jgi:hypothetical protein
MFGSRIARGGANRRCPVVAAAVVDSGDTHRNLMV